jgi:hypothetical protein
LCQRAESSSSDAELAREEVVDGQLRGRVVRHHDAGFAPPPLRVFMKFETKPPLLFATCSSTHQPEWHRRDRR